MRFGTALSTFEIILGAALLALVVPTWAAAAVLSGVLGGIDECLCRDAWDDQG